MKAEEVLETIRNNPEGLWIREIARKSRCSPASVCNYLYGYRDAKGREIKPLLAEYVEIERVGGGAVTLVRPRSEYRK